MPDEQLRQQLLQSMHRQGGYAGAQPQQQAPYWMRDFQQSPGLQPRQSASGAISSPSNFGHCFLHFAFVLIASLFYGKYSQAGTACKICQQLAARFAC